MLSYFPYYSPQRALSFSFFYLFTLHSHGLCLTERNTFLMGFQGGFTKYPCCLYLWDSRDSVAQYLNRDWPQQIKFSVENNSAKWEALLDPRKILLPLLHLKLGLMKQFVRAPNKSPQLLGISKISSLSWLQQKFKPVSLLLHKKKIGHGMQGVS